MFYAWFCPSHLAESRAYLLTAGKHPADSNIIALSISLFSFYIPGITAGKMNHSSKIVTLQQRHNDIGNFFLSQTRSFFQDHGRKSFTFTVQCSVDALLVHAPVQGPTRVKTNDSRVLSHPFSRSQDHISHPNPLLTGALTGHDAHAFSSLDPRLAE